MLSFSGPQLSCQDPKALVVLLHGYGAEGANLISMAQGLWLPQVFFWCPDAPSPCEEYPMGRQWFSLKTLELRSQTPPFSEAFQNLISPAAEQLVGRLQEGLRNFKGPVVIGGFSQGAALAYHVGLQTMPVQGVLGFSGFYHLTAAPRFAPPLFWCHGGADDVVPLSWMTHAVDQMKKYGLSLETHVMPREAHIISPQGLAKGREFLSKMLS